MKEVRSIFLSARKLMSYSSFDKNGSRKMGAKTKIKKGPCNTNYYDCSNGAKLNEKCVLW